MRSRLMVLLAEKSEREGRRITLREVARDTGISLYTLSAFANNTIREAPLEALDKLCRYIPCDVGELLVQDKRPQREEQRTNKTSAQPAAVF